MKDKLNRKQAEEIRSLYPAVCECCGQRLWTMSGLGRKYGVSTPAIYNIIIHKAYREKAK